MLLACGDYISGFGYSKRFEKEEVHPSKTLKYLRMNFYAFDVR
jgi:hypothetical protein